MDNELELKTYMQAITAGALIGLCADIYTRVGGLAGAVFFGIGLATICYCKLPLFTGRIGSASWNPFSILCLILVLLLNAAGATLVAAISMIDHPFVFGLFCGCLMQIAVTLKDKPYLIILCIAAFICSGYKHCVAMAYTEAKFDNIPMLDWLFVIIGNAVGAKLMYLGGVKYKEDKNDA